MMLLHCNGTTQYILPPSGKAQFVTPFCITTTNPPNLFWINIYITFFPDFNVPISKSRGFRCFVALFAAIIMCHFRLNSKFSLENRLESVWQREKLKGIGYLFMFWLRNQIFGASTWKGMSLQFWSGSVGKVWLGGYSIWRNYSIYDWLILRIDLNIFLRTYFEAIYF